MYEITFQNVGKDLAAGLFDSTLFVEDLERALALASMLGKISTPKVGFTNINVSPSNFNDHEK